MSYASLTTVIDHENPSNPPYTILEGASSTETEPLAIINDLADERTEPSSPSPARHPAPP